jgi:hypothetical protein
MRSGLSVLSYKVGTLPEVLCYADTQSSCSRITFNTIHLTSSFVPGHAMTPPYQLPPPTSKP